MARLKEYNGHYCESEYEYAFIGFLEAEGWIYSFGDEIDRYTMDQAVADGLTVSIKYHPRIAKVLLDKVKVKEIEDYYKKCADDGATYEDIEASKKAMSSMEVILGEPSRLERLAKNMILEYLQTNDQITSAKIQEMCGFTKQQARSVIDKMRSEKLINLKGKGPAARYEEQYFSITL